MTTELVVVPLSSWSQSPKLSQAVTSPQSFVYVRSTDSSSYSGPPSLFGNIVQSPLQVTTELVVVPLSSWSQSPKLSQAVTSPQSFVYVRSTDSSSYSGDYRAGRGPPLKLVTVP